MPNAFVTIVIPAKNAQSSMNKCLDSVLKLDYSPYEVIVINDGSTDNTAGILDAYPGIKVINTSGVGPAKARNTAVKQARGEFIAFTDADCYADKDWLTELIAGFTAADIASVGGCQRPAVDEGLFGKQVFRFMLKSGLLTDYGRSCSGNTARVSHNPSCNSMYRKEIFLQAGGFLEGLWPGEDVELDRRLSGKGFLMVFNPRAVVYHYRVRDRRAFLRMMDRYGWAQAILVKKHGFFRRIQLAPLITLPVLIFWLGLLFFKPLLSAGAALLSVGLAWAWFYFDFSLTVLAFQGIIAWHWGYIKGIFDNRCLKA